MISRVCQFYSIEMWVGTRPIELPLKKKFFPKSRQRNILENIIILLHQEERLHQLIQEYKNMSSVIVVDSELKDSIQEYSQIIDNIKIP